MVGHEECGVRFVLHHVVGHCRRFSGGNVGWIAHDEIVLSLLGGLFFDHFQEIHFAKVDLSTELRRVVSRYRERARRNVPSLNSRLRQFERQRDGNATGARTHVEQAGGGLLRQRAGAPFHEFIRLGTGDEYIGGDGKSAGAEGFVAQDVLHRYLLAQCLRVSLYFALLLGGECHRAVHKQLRTAQLQAFAHIVFSHGGGFARRVDGGQFSAQGAVECVGRKGGSVHGFYLSAFMSS